MNFVVVNYRGYGASTGSPDPTNLQADGVSVAKYLETELGIVNLIAHGESMEKLKPSDFPPRNEKQSHFLWYSAANILASLSELMNIDPPFWKKSSPQQSGLAQGYCVDWKTLSCGRLFSGVSSHQ
jgi:hypothetical protein